MSTKAEITFTMSKPEPKKHSVKFSGGEKDPLTNIYLMRDAMKKAGVKDLDEVKELEITVRVKK